MIRALHGTQRKLNIDNVKYLCSLASSEQCTRNSKLEDVKPPNWHDAKPFESIPGPKPIPILGNLWRFIPGIGNYAGLEFHELNLKQNKEYGDIMILKDFKIRSDIVFVYNSKDTETMFRNEGPAPNRDVLPSIKHYRLTMRKEIFQGYGGVFTADGKDWQEARSKVNPVLMQPRTVKMYNKAMNDIAQEMIVKTRGLAKKHPEGELPEDFFTEINKWGLESVTYMALNKRLGVIEEDSDPNSEKQKFVANALQFFELLYKIDVVPNLSKYISTPTWRKYIRTLDELTNYAKGLFDEAVKEAEQNKNKPYHSMSILEKLLSVEEKIAFGTIFDMLLGGIDTTSRAVSAFLYYVARHPDKQKILLEELRRILPTPDTPVDHEQLAQMPYLRACIKESLRLAPVAVGVSRKTYNDMVLSGYQIPKGTVVLTSLFTMSRNEKYFEQPNEFIPERWLRENRGNENIDPWVALPFGFGPRTCIGKRLATMEMETFAAKFMRNFHTSWPHKDMRFSMTMLYGIADPLKLHIKPVDH